MPLIVAVALPHASGSHRCFPHATAGQHPPSPPPPLVVVLVLLKPVTWFGALRGLASLPLCVGTCLHQRFHLKWQVQCSSRWSFTLKYSEKMFELACITMDQLYIIGELRWIWGLNWRDWRPNSRSTDSPVLNFGAMFLKTKIKIDRRNRPAILGKTEWH